MADREKVYFVNGGMFTKTKMVCKALQQCTMPSDSEGYDTQCSDCPYFDPDCSVRVCKQQLCGDALELLKEQEAVEPDKDSEGTCSCGNCGETVGYYPVGCNTPNKFCKFCPECGKSVKWE